MQSCLTAMWITLAFGVSLCRAYSDREEPARYPQQRSVPNEARRPGEEHLRTDPRRTHLYDLSTQWEPIGPEGGYVRCMVMDAADHNVIHGVVYTSPARFFTSTDRGQSWTLVSTIGAGYVWCLAIDPLTPDVLYAGSYNNVYKSTDAGFSWRGSSTQTTGQVYDLEVDPFSSDVVWGAGYHWNGSHSMMTVLKSTDGGSTWSPRQLHTADDGCGFCVAVDPVDNGVAYVGGDYRDGSYVPGLFRTTDGGVSWTEVAAGITGEPVYDIVIDPSSHTTLYAGVWDGVHKSTNSGDSWTNTGSGYYNYCLALDPSSPSTIYTGHWEEIRKSTDGGRSWSSTGGGIFGYYLCSLLVDPVITSRVYAGNYVGSFRTENGGGNWSLAVSGMLGKETNDLVVGASSPHPIYVAVANDGLYRTSPSRSVWTRLGEFVDCDEVEAMALEPQNYDRIYALTGG